MERTITQNQEESPVIDRHDIPIVLFKYTYDLLRKEGKDYPNLIALYLFYYSTALWQGTNTIFATNPFTCKGLDWEKEKLFRIKNRLKELNLIETVINTDKDTGQITGHYIYVRFIWNNKLHENPQGGKSTLWPEGGNSHRWENPPTNALRTLSLNAIRTNKEESSPSKNLPDDSIRRNGKKDKRIEMFLPAAKKLSDIIKKNKNITTTAKQLNSWAASIGLLTDENKISPERIDDVLDWYDKHIGGQYIPVVESGNSFRTKFIRLETAMKNNGYPDRTKASKPEKIIRYGEEYYLNRERDEYYNKQGERYR